MNEAKLYSAALAAALLAACGVGDVTGIDDDDSRADAAPTGGGDGEGGGDGDAAPTGGADASTQPVACTELVDNVDSGEHNPGLPCLGCHGPGGEDPQMTVGGTLYSDLQGTQPVPGATITVVDANGTELELVVARNGNFWTEEAVVFPLQVQGSLCPDTVPMIAPVNEGDGDCNRGGCHDADYRIFLPQ